VQESSYMLGRSSLMYGVMKLEEYGYIEWWLEWNFKGNSCELLVCVRTCGIHIGWYPETPIIIHAQIE